MPEIEARRAALEAKLGEVAKTTRRLYQIFLWTGVVRVLAIVLPLALAAFALPRTLDVLSAYSGVAGI